MDIFNDLSDKLIGHTYTILGYNDKGFYDSVQEAKEALATTEFKAEIKSFCSLLFAYSEGFDSGELNDNGDEYQDFSYNSQSEFKNDLARNDLFSDPDPIK